MHVIVLCQIKQCTELDVFYWSSNSGISEVDFMTQIGKNNVKIPYSELDAINSLGNNYEYLL